MTEIKMNGDLNLSWLMWHMGKFGGKKERIIKEEGMMDEQHKQMKALHFR